MKVIWGISHLLIYPWKCSSRCWGKDSLQSFWLLNVNFWVCCIFISMNLFHWQVFSYLVPLHATVFSQAYRPWVLRLCLYFSVKIVLAQLIQGSIQGYSRNSMLFSIARIRFLNSNQIMNFEDNSPFRLICSLGIVTEDCVLQEVFSPDLQVT